MTPVSDDLVLRRLALMTPRMPDPAHAARVRARCHDAMAKERRSTDPAAEARDTRGRLLELLVVGAVTLGYLSAVVRGALVMSGAW